jgi:hypothetical protein
MTAQIEIREGVFHFLPFMVSPAEIHGKRQPSKAIINERLKKDRYL